MKGFVDFPDIKETRDPKELTDEEVEMEFRFHIASLSEEQFWRYCESWFDPQIMERIMSDWETSLKREELVSLRKIAKEFDKQEIGSLSFETEADENDINLLLEQDNIINDHHKDEE